MDQELWQWLVETKDEPLEGMAEFFDARLAEYETHMARWRQHYQWMAELLPATVTDLLDLGCGSGLELDAIFAIRPRVRVTGVDLSAQMLAKLRQKQVGKALHLVCEDYFRYEMGESCFDAVIAFETLHHFSAIQKETLFAKIFRCLRPNGIFLECDYIAQSREIEELLFAECARRRRRDGIDEAVFVHFDTPLTLAHEMDAIRAGGFQTVELVGFLPGDAHTPLIRARKCGL